MSQKEPKTGFFEIIVKFGHYIYFFLKLCCYVLCSCKIPYLGKIWYEPKCIQPVKFQYFYISHISIANWCKSLILNTDFWKLKIYQKFSGGQSQKWMWPLLSRDSKIGCANLVFLQIKKFINYTSRATLWQK